MTDISAVVQLQETVLQATIGSTDPGSGTDLTLGASVADVLSLAGQQLNAEGPAGDVLLFWDASAGKLTYLNLADGLSITGTNLTVTATGTGTVTSVNISPPAAGITVSGGPITSSGSITLALANDLAAVEGLSGTGIVRRTAADTWSAGTAVDLSSEVTGQLPYTSLAGAPNLSLKADLIGGVIPTSQLPSLAITEFLGTAANQAAMLTFSGQRGDWCIRTDAGANGGTWVLVVDGGSSLAHWQRLGYPIAPVSSVNSQTGNVVLGFGDVGAAPADQGVTNGNNHNHDGDDGAQIAYNSLLGLPSIPSTYADLGPIGDGIIFTISNRGETATPSTNYDESLPLSFAVTITKVTFITHIDNTGSSTTTLSAYKRTAAGTKTSLLSANATLVSGASVVVASLSATAGVLSLAAGDRLGVDLVGLGTGASGIKCIIEYTRSAV